MAAILKESINQSINRNADLYKNGAIYKKPM